MPSGIKLLCNVTEIEKLKEEIVRGIEELRRRGVSGKEIVSLFKPIPKPPSRLVVTNDNRLILPDYNGIEVSMPPLPKAVYMLFLRHPEGIDFKYLPDYTDELREIYLSMKLRTEAPKKVEKSIIDVTNPLNHSIIEKCTRIRRSFLKVVPRSVAKHYIITGGRANTKRILLDRMLVIWEKENPPLDL